MKAMIIGGAGFVGAYLTRHLHDDLKWEVVVTNMPGTDKSECKSSKSEYFRVG